MKRQLVPFSVLMSVYSKENPQHFEEALASNLLYQTCRPDEFVLICDGPLTKELDRVIETYTEAFPDVVTVYRLPECGGLGNALNYGLERCTHELVARADSDDVCAPDRFELQISYMQSHPEISLLSGAIDEFTDSWQMPKRFKPLPLTNDELRKYAQTRNPMNHMAVVFRKSDVQSVGSYQHLTYLEDYYLWIRMMAVGMQFANLPQCMVHARVGNGMEQRRGDKCHIAGWKVLDRYMVEHGLLTQSTYRMNIFKLRIWCFVPNKVRELLYSYVLRKKVPYSVTVPVVPPATEEYEKVTDNIAV